MHFTLEPRRTSWYSRFEQIQFPHLHGSHSPDDMAESFGTRLRQQRERRRISIASIASETKISVLLLERLERDDFTHWPNGIFGRSFVRTYAHAIGLDPDPVVREFVELHPDPVEIGIAGLTDAEEPANERPTTRLGGLVARAFSRARPQAQTNGTAAVEPGGAPRLIAPPAIAPPPPPAPTSPRPDVDLAAVAHVCTELGRVRERRDAALLVEAAAKLLDAVGLIVWIWDPEAEALRPMLAHGYSEEMLARLPRVCRDAPNATAACFRSAQPRTVAGTPSSSGAVVLPLLTAAGCVGALGVELRDGGEQRDSVRAVAAIFAAQLAAWVGLASLADPLSLTHLPHGAPDANDAPEDHEPVAIAASS
jgi:transcriptional regulator with XRE-family HTH domain